MCEREGGEGGREGLKQAQLLKKQNYSLLCGKIVLNACIFTRPVCNNQIGMYISTMTINTEASPCSL